MLHAVLEENLTIHDPGPLRARLLRLAMYRRKGWVPPGQMRTIRFYTNEPEAIVLPRGLLPAVQAVAPLEVEDRRHQLAPVEFRWRATLRPEQAEAAAALVRAGGGMLVGMPGSGKTNTALAVVAALRQPTLWLVHTRDLARQALQRAQSLFDLPRGAFGYVGEGVYRIGSHLTVGIIQSISRSRIFRLKKHFGCIVVDEAHHVPALTVARLVSQFPARYRLGCTATPERTDALEPLTMAILGPAVATIDPEQLLARGRILLPTVRIVPTAFRHTGETHWAALQKGRAADAGRNELVCSLVAGAAKGGRLVIVLAELVAHARLLAAMLRQRGIPAMAVVGNVPPEERRKVFEAVAKGQLVLVATKLADEGLDLPALDCLVLAAPGRSAPRLQQQVGRVMRSFTGKSTAVVYDLVDVGVEVLRDQALDRLQVYQSLGLPVMR